MTNLWSGLVDQIAFVNFIPWVDTYNDEINNIKAPCSDLWRRMFIWLDGKVNPCDSDYKSKLVVGNINDNNISELWKSDKYGEYRRIHISNSRKNKTLCWEISTRQ